MANSQWWLCITLICAFISALHAGGDKTSCFYEYPSIVPEAIAGIVLIAVFAVIGLYLGRRCKQLRKLKAHGDARDGDVELGEVSSEYEQLDHLNGEQHAQNNLQNEGTDSERSANAISATSSSVADASVPETTDAYTSLEDEYAMHAATPPANPPKPQTESLLASDAPLVISDEHEGFTDEIDGDSERYMPPTAHSNGSVGDELYVCEDAFCNDPSCPTHLHETSISDENIDHKHTSVADNDSTDDETESSSELMDISMESTQFDNSIYEKERRRLIRRWVCWGFTFVLLGTLLVAAAAFPAIPEFSVCQTRLQWTSVFYGLIHGSLSGDVHVALSVYNPNRFDLDLRHGRFTFFYGKAGHRIGTGHIKPAVFPAGSVRPVILYTNFQPGYKWLWSMLEDHLAGKLILTVDGDVSTTLFNWQSHSLVYNSSVIQSVDVEEEADVRFCWCEPEKPPT